MQLPCLDVIIYSMPMAKTIPMVIVLLLSSAAYSQAPADPLPPVPELGLGDGTALLDLARSAMSEYLRTRAPADKQFIPDRLAALAKRPYSARLTLRKDGVVAATSIQQGRELGRNVIAAALEVMRGAEPLPDKVTPAVLDATTLDLEVFTATVPIDGNAEAFARLAMPGLTGVKATRGVDESFVFPSAQLQDGLTPSRIRNLAIAQLPVKPENVRMPIRWSAFSVAQFVSYPQEKVVWLYRGKALQPFGAMDPNAVRTGASLVADFLVRSQDTSGQFIAPLAQPSLREHMYATYALARLAKATGREDYSKTVNAAMHYAMTCLREEAGGAFLMTEAEDDQLAATALMLLAIGELKPNDQIAAVRAKLAAAMRRALRDGWPTATLDRSSTQPASLLNATLAGLALSRLAESNAPAIQPPPKLVAQDALSACWMIRAGLAETRNWEGVTTALPLPVPIDSPLDEAGGFAAQGQAPTTVVTALAAVNLAAGKTWPGLSSDLPPAAREAMVLDAQRFCYQMMYKVHETYFMEKPIEWIGGVRGNPQTGRVSLDACAAAIEAFLAK